MEKKPHLMAIVLFLTGLICIGLLFGLSYKTYRKIDTVDQKMASVIKPVQQKQKSMKEDIELYTAKIEKKQAADKYLQQRAQTEKAVKNSTGEHAGAGRRRKGRTGQNAGGICRRTRGTFRDHRKTAESEIRA